MYRPDALGADHNAPHTTPSPNEEAMTADVTSTTTLDNIQREQEQRLRDELTPSRSMDQLVKEAQRSAQMQSTKENNNV
jgi:hypothetical protein